MKNEKQSFCRVKKFTQLQRHKETCLLNFFTLCVCAIEVSVPVAEVVGVENGRVEILPQKSVEDTDKDFTGGF